MNKLKKIQEALEWLSIDRNRVPNKADTIACEKAQEALKELKEYREVEALFNWVTLTDDEIIDSFVMEVSKKGQRTHMRPIIKRAYMRGKEEVINTINGDSSAKDNQSTET